VRDFTGIDGKLYDDVIPRNLDTRTEIRKAYSPIPASRITHYAKLLDPCTKNQIRQSFEKTTKPIIRTKLLPKNSSIILFKYETIYCNVLVRSFGLFTIFGIYTRWRNLLRHYATSRKVAGSNPDEVIVFFNWPNPSSRTMALGSTHPLTEMSTRNLPGSKGWSARRADNLIAICEPTVLMMWEPRPITHLWAFMACYRDSFTFFLYMQPTVKRASKG
jgi:hypothetical protein